MILDCIDVTHWWGKLRAAIGPAYNDTELFEAAMAAARLNHQCDVSLSDALIWAVENNDHIDHVRIELVFAREQAEAVRALPDDDVKSVSEDEEDVRPTRRGPAAKGVRAEILHSTEKRDINVPTWQQRGAYHLTDTFAGRCDPECLRLSETEICHGQINLPCDIRLPDKIRWPEDETWHSFLQCRKELYRERRNKRAWLKNFWGIAA